MNLAETLIKEQEGCRLTAYKDSLGMWTAGVGHLLDQTIDWTDCTFTQDMVDTWLDSDIKHALTIASDFPHWTELGDVRQAVLCSMCFQLGYKPLHWPKFMAALQAQDYAAAALAGLDSLWHQQTPKRAELEMKMLETSQWIGD